MLSTTVRSSDEPLRVLFLFQDTGRLFGAERATLDLAEGLARDGRADPRVLLIEETRLGGAPAGLRAALDARGLRWSAACAHGAVSPGLVRAIRDRVREDRVQVLHVYGYKALVHGGIAVRWGRIAALVATVHGWLDRPDRKEQFYGWIDRMALRRCGRVIVLSEYYRSLLAARMPESRLALIPTGMDPLPTPARPAPTGRPFTFGFLGRLSSEKDPGLLIRAAQGMRDQGLSVRFLLAGEGPEHAALERAIREADLAGRMELAGFLERDVFFSRVDALVLCSRMENLPLAVMEAMAAGVPVAAARAGGVPDLVADRVSGRLFPPGDEHALCEILSDWAAHPEHAAALGRAGRQRLADLFPKTKWIERHLALYRELQP